MRGLKFAVRLGLVSGRGSLYVGFHGVTLLSPSARPSELYPLFRPAVTGLTVQQLSWVHHFWQRSSIPKYAVFIWKSWQLARVCNLHLNGENPDNCSSSLSKAVWRGYMDILAAFNTAEDNAQIWSFDTYPIFAPSYIHWSHTSAKTQ